MTDRQLLEEILGLLRVIAFEPEDDMKPDEAWMGAEKQSEAQDQALFGGMGLPDRSSGNDEGGLPRVAIVKSPLSGENFMWQLRRAGDSTIEEIKQIVNLGKG